MVAFSELPAPQKKILEYVSVRTADRSNPHVPLAHVENYSGLDDHDFSATLREMGRKGLIQYCKNFVWLLEEGQTTARNGNRKKIEFFEPEDPPEPPRRRKTSTKGAESRKVKGTCKCSRLLIFVIICIMTLSVAFTAPWECIRLFNDKSDFNDGGGEKWKCVVNHYRRRKIEMDPESEKRQHEASWNVKVVASTTGGDPTTSSTGAVDQQGWSNASGATIAVEEDQGGKTIPIGSYGRYSNLTCASSSKILPNSSRFAEDLGGSNAICATESMEDDQGGNTTSIGMVGQLLNWVIRRLKILVDSIFVVSALLLGLCLFLVVRYAKPYVFAIIMTCYGMVLGVAMSAIGLHLYELARKCVSTVLCLVTLIFALLLYKGIKTVIAEAVALLHVATAIQGEENEQQEEENESKQEENKQEENKQRQEERKKEELENEQEGDGREEAKKELEEEKEQEPERIQMKEAAVVQELRAVQGMAQVLLAPEEVKEHEQDKKIQAELMVPPGIAVPRHGHSPDMHLQVDKSKSFTPLLAQVEQPSDSSSASSSPTNRENDEGTGSLSSPDVSRHIFGDRPLTEVAQLKRGYTKIAQSEDEPKEKKSKID